MTSWLIHLLSVTILAALPLLLALPWLAAVDPDGFRAQVRRPQVWGWTLGGWAAVVVLIVLILPAMQDRDRLQLLGRGYGCLLQLMLLGDLLVVLVLLGSWSTPNSGAVALAAFREGIRQPIFPMLAVGAVCLMLISTVLPYFTFGEDYRMMKHLGFDMVMLFTALFAVITASQSISEEIEGRTAVTLLSKPLSRRQFLLGKFSGILLAALTMAALLGWCLNWALYVKPMLDFEDVADPLQSQLEPELLALAQLLAPVREIRWFLEGTSLWFAGALAILPGLVIGFCQVMLFLAIATALATRLPVAANLLTCLVIFFLGNLAPYLVIVSDSMQRDYQRLNQGDSSMTLELVQFVARMFSTVLPALEYFGLGPAIIRGEPLPIGPYAIHVLLVIGYSILYTAIALLFGLILFEDRDLA